MHRSLARIRTSLDRRGPASGATSSRWATRIALVAALAVLAGGIYQAGSTAVMAVSGVPATYTTTADFNEGTGVNVVTTGDEVKLDDTTTPFGFIWIAVSSKNTVVKINTDTGAVVGEYWSAPQGSGKGDPSRTTVDKNGSVWVGNRSGGSVVHIGLEENGQCVDRNGNSVIDTSTGQGDVLGWPGVSPATAVDECIIHYTQTAGFDVRHLSVDANNDVWASGVFSKIFEQIDGGTGLIVRTEGPVGYGGYGGLIDANDVIWSAAPMLRWDTANPLSGPNGGNWNGYAHSSYGLCIDPSGNVWNTEYGPTIRKFNPAGVLVGAFWHGSGAAQGCVADANGDIWVAGSLSSSQVDHLKNDGTYLGSVAVGNGPTGVSVDANGKVWATNYSDGTASRIDPTLAGGVGAVDFTTVWLGGNTYNYSDMTGSTLIGAPDNGTWTVDHDSGIVGAEWGSVSWNALQPGDSAISVSVQSSVDGVTFGASEGATSGGDVSVANGQYLRVTVSFTRATTGETPVLYDLAIDIANEPPVCTAAAPSDSEIWPPNHQFVPITISGVTDPDGDPVTVTVDSIFQDEPTDTFGDGQFTPDGSGVGTSTADVRAERAGTKKLPGDGRFYHIAFTADDGNGGTCSGSVAVSVPHDVNEPAVDGGPLYDSTLP